MEEKMHTILLVEDEAPLLDMMVKVLEDAHYKVIKATNGKEGLETALKEEPDLILTDNRMPIMDGVDMIAELRQSQWGANVPAILLTSMYDLDAMNKTVESQTDYVMKADIGLDKIVSLVEGRLKPTTP